MASLIDKILALFGVGRTTPLLDEIEALKEVIQNLSTEKLIAEDRLRSALEDKQQLWGVMQTALGEERKAYQMQLNVQYQRQGLEAPYPEAPHIPAHRQTAYQVPKDPIIERPMLGSELVARHKKEIREKYLSGDPILE